MDPNEMERRFKAAIAELRLSPEQAQLLAAGLVQTDKSAQAQGVTYKSNDAPQVYTALDGTAGLIVDGRFVALKAGAPVMDAEDDPALGGDSGVDEATEGEPPMDGSGEYIGDMTPAEFWMQFKQYLAELLAPQTKMEEMAKAFASGLGELKSLYATKDTSTLKDTGTMARIQQLEAELARLKGDQPAVSASDALAALKSTGPQAPPDPNAVQVPDEPGRPFAALGAATMPALYQTNPQGGFVGWMPPAQPPQSS